MMRPIITPVFVPPPAAGVGVGVGATVGVGVTAGAAAYTANMVKWLICKVTVCFAVSTVEGSMTHLPDALS